MASRSLLLSKLPLLRTAAATTSSSRLIRPLAAASVAFSIRGVPAAAPRGLVRCFSTQPATSSLRDSSPNWSNRPPKETILLDGCDFEHWLVVMEPPPGDPGNPDVTRDEIIDSYIKTLAQVVGSEEEARQKIYSVSTRHYFAFGALVSEELSYKIKELPKVRWVLPDSYLDVKNKDYGGEPFINGQAVPYDPKYHEEWVRNNARANERSRRSDRPRNFDRSRNFERRRENTQNFQNRDVPPGQGFNAPPPGQGFNAPPPGQGFNASPPGQGFNAPPPPGQNPMPPRDAPPMHHSPGNMPPPPPPPPNMGGAPSYQPQMPRPQAGFPPGGGPNYQPGGAPGYSGGAPAYQGGGQGYQGNPGGGMHGGPGPVYQGGNPGYQGGAPGYQGGNPPPYPGGNPPPYPGGNPPPYPGGNPNYNAGAPNYGGGVPGNQGQGGNPQYQQGSPNYGGGAPGYDGRDRPGGNYQ